MLRCCGASDRATVLRWGGIHHDGWRTFDRGCRRIRPGWTCQRSRHRWGVLSKLGVQSLGHRPKSLVYTMHGRTDVHIICISADQHYQAKKRVCNAPRIECRVDCGGLRRHSDIFFASFLWFFIIHFLSCFLFNSFLIG